MVREENPKAPTLISGAVVVSTIFVVAALMALFAWWHRFQQGRQAIEFWGKETAQLIRHAPEVELWRLKIKESDLQGADNGDNGKQANGEKWNSLRVGKDTFEIVKRKDISQAPGLVHARHALIVDGNYVWNKSSKKDAEDNAQNSDDDSENWDIAVSFRGQDARATVLFDFQTDRVRLAGGKSEAQLVEKIMNGMQDYFSRQLKTGETPP